ncbi:anti-sigma factor [Lentzea sp. NPDC006480]|uniref:anti-sigma factor n=1 Tax=Lentzea sp. NPDC006480 TaxID=3157176 RepID=UPI0033AD1A49
MGNPVAFLVRTANVKPGERRATNPHLLTGAYALGALPSAEREEFRIHLTECDTCTDEVSGLLDATTRLADVVEQPAPRALRARVLAATQQAWQLPPQVRSGAQPEMRLPRRHGIRRAAGLILTACVAAAVVLVAHGAQFKWKAAPRPSAREMITAPRSQIGELLTASDLKLAVGRGFSGTASTVAFSRHRDKLLFQAEILPAVPARHVYQLWLVRADGPRSAGLLHPALRPWSLMVSGISGVAEVLVTAEPAGGSPSPTSAAMVTIALA